MYFTTDVAIIGAGPYGLSLAAHLRALGVDFLIFGNPMHTWLTQMPRGMRLKSEGFASTLYDPDSAFTLAHYCRREGIPYADLGLPIRVETFAAYGLEFQKRFAPELDREAVISLTASSSGFRLRLGNGASVTARRVVTAVGISHYQYLPPVLSSLPEEFATHTSGHTVFDEFKGREVAVIGAGASALDVAAALHGVGAEVRLVSRKPAIHFHEPPGRIPRPLLERLRSPMTGLGPGWRSLFCTRAPLVFRQMPEKFRLKVVDKHLGPAPGWFVKDQVAGRVPFLLGYSLKQAAVENGRVRLELASRDGAVRTLFADHVIAGTGYKVDLRRLSFLDGGVREALRSVNHSPVLSSTFESSVPGLYFVGASSATTFGPLARFAFGAKFTSPRLSRHLAKSASGTIVEKEMAAV